VVAEPIPLRLGQVLDETKDGGAAVDQDPAQLLIRQPVGLLQHTVPGERQERQGRVELARVDAWHRLPLGLRHAATVTQRPIKQTDRLLQSFPRADHGAELAHPGCRAGHHRQMTQNQPETSREQLAKQAVAAYNELTAHAEELSPQAAQAVRSLRETLTSLVALGTAADLQIADMEHTMEEFEAIFYSGDVTVSARLLRRHLTPQQRAELARLITEP